MLLTSFAFVCICCCFGSVSTKSVTVCGGQNVEIVDNYSPSFFGGKLYFTPYWSRSKTLVVENGMAKNPRYQVSGSLVYLMDAKLTDKGRFSISHDYGFTSNVLELTVFDCAEYVERSYGSSYKATIPRNAAILEFIPSNEDLVSVLWNRTDLNYNRGGRGYVKQNRLLISDLTQKDNGFYTFRERDRTFIQRIHLNVTANTVTYDEEEGSRLLIRYNFPVEETTLTLSRYGSAHTLMRKGQWDKYAASDFPGLMAKLNWVADGLEIDPVNMRDAGSYEFTDESGNLVLIADVVVTEPTPWFAYVAPVVTILLLILCCCYVKKCCCSNSTSKRDRAAPQTDAAPLPPTSVAAPPAGPSAYQPVSQSSSSAQPAVTYFPPPAYRSSTPEPAYSPPAYDMLSFHPLQPEVTAPGGPPAALPASSRLDCLSSDAEPRFELKGLIASAPPLSSDSPHSDVYTSAKLNFL